MGGIEKRRDEKRNARILMMRKISTSGGREGHRRDFRLEMKDGKKGSRSQGEIDRVQGYMD